MKGANKKLFNDEMRYVNAIFKAFWGLNFTDAAICCYESVTEMCE